MSLHDLRFEKISGVPAAKIFAFSGINRDLPSLLVAWQFLKKKYPESVFIIGGPITWSFEQEKKIHALFCFDHIFILDGEESLPLFLRQVWQNHSPEATHHQQIDLPQIIRSSRFDLSQSRPARWDLLKSHAWRYYAGLVEVSRGCPFLCEFCDIRVLPDNNRCHCRNINAILADLDALHGMGMHRIQLCCDNFIGSTKWAHDCVDRIIEWKKQMGSRAAFWTWLTIDIAKKPRLMKKMREAGFEMLFIGIESFHHNSILETAKVQNLKSRDGMISDIKTIQSYGFIVVPGLIFGFDSDPPDVFDLTLRGMESSGLLGGDPSFLVALPGTPLYQRMQETGRLVAENTDSTLSSTTRTKKIRSNIRYLQHRQDLVSGFQKFIKDATSAGFVRSRFKNHVENIRAQNNHVAGAGLPFFDPVRAIWVQLGSFHSIFLFVRRSLLFLRPDRFMTVLWGLGTARTLEKQFPGITRSFYFFVFTWSNLLLKYQRLKKSDFEIFSVDENYNFSTLWEYVEGMEKEDLVHQGWEGPKTAIQQRKTREALVKLKKNFLEVPSP